MHENIDVKPTIIIIIIALKWMKALREISQLMKCLPHKHENQILKPKAHVRKLGVIIHVCNPSNRKVEKDSLASQPSPISKTKASEKPCFKKQDR